ncbi:branched-chain amino acid ABC transporter permease [Angustibacter aerolatus]
MSLLKSVRTAAAPPVRRTVQPVRSGRRALLEPLVFAVVLSLIHLLVDQSLQFVLTLGVVYALLTASLGVLLGWSGVYSFGHAAFFGAGAYAAGLLKDHDLSPLLVVLAGTVVAAAAAVAVGALGARIVGVEFALLTLVVGQVAYLLTFKLDLLQGDNGVYGIPAGTLAGRDLTDGQHLWWYTVVVVAVLLGVLRRVQLSPYGAGLNAVRDDPVKAAAIGLPVRALRLSAFTLSGAVAGVAGVLFAQQQGIVTPTTLTFTFSGQIIVMLLLGGLHRFWGAAVGAIVFVLLDDRLFGETTHHSLVLGLILLVVVVVLPRGLLGLAEPVTALVRRRRSS